MDPKFKINMLPSGSMFIRFADLEDAYYYDDPSLNPTGIGIRRITDHYEEDHVSKYMRERSIMTPEKYKIIEDVKKEVESDRSFLELIYKSKSEKRKYVLNKFVGNLSIVDYARHSDKLFNRLMPGAKKQTLNLAFQVGTFLGGNYNESFKKIIKTIMTCQALNIALNIDMFDSDTNAVKGCPSYVMINVACSSEKINYKKIMATSYREFFTYTLFNGYSASGRHNRIGTFLSQSTIMSDLGPYYDVIGGNMLTDNEGMTSKVLKIGGIR